HYSDPSGHNDAAIHLPASTAWPIVLAFGITLVFAGVVTNAIISILGGVLALSGCVGWFRQVLPHEAHEEVPAEEHKVTIASTRKHVARIDVSEEHRAHLPVEIYPVLSGLKGGIAGGIAMIFPALLYGLLSHHSIWYPVNLLGGAGVAHWTNPTTEQIAAFHLQALVIATMIHIAASVLVGLLYGAMLPMLPRNPIVLGGIVAPLLWTGLLHSSLGVINPALDARISWGWFVLSQIAFGIVAGVVVVRQEKIKTGQSIPFVLRMGIEASGLPREGFEEMGDRRS
ncbi:MAG TPA: hypothetical protein VH164_12495, partial [Ktedonobacteraceae bacterium]|nr:hypothetical protein [Ktedonobacteraceae bacterium]